MRICSINLCGKKHFSKGFCEKHYHADRYLKNRDQIAANNKRWYEANKDQVIQSSVERKRRNKEVVRAQERQRRLENPAPFKEKSRRWARANPRKCNARVAKRKAALLRAVPAWADLEKIKEIYRNCPEGYVVDHEVPLQGENVCGLHVEDNLRYITPYENAVKSNKWPY